MEGVFPLLGAPGAAGLDEGGVIVTVVPVVLEMTLEMKMSLARTVCATVSAVCAMTTLLVVVLR